MSDIGKVKNPSKPFPFPSVRKSSDAFQPEIGEIEFTLDLDEYDNLNATAVQESVRTEQPIISDQENKKNPPRKNLSPQNKKKPTNPEDLEDQEDQGTPIIDIQA